MLQNDWGTLAFILLLMYRYFVGVRLGDAVFYQVIKDSPDAACLWFTLQKDWKVLPEGHPDAKWRGSVEGLEGPFVFYMPLKGENVYLYASKEQFESARAAFMQAFAGSPNPASPAWPSLLALAYPISACLSFPSTAGILETFGYGLANLGFLLAAAGVLVGHFHILGLVYRKNTLIAAVAAFLVGTLLVNV